MSRLYPLFNAKSTGQKSPGAFTQDHAGAFDALILDMDGTLLDNMEIIAWIDAQKINALLQAATGDKHRIFVEPKDLLVPEIRGQGFNERVRRIAGRHSVDPQTFSAACPETDMLRRYKQERDGTTTLFYELLAAFQTGQVASLRVFLGAEDFLKKHRERATPMAVASSNEQIRLKAALGASGLSPLFTDAAGTLRAYGCAYFTGPDGRESRRPVKPAPPMFSCTRRNSSASLRSAASLSGTAMRM